MPLLAERVAGEGWPLQGEMQLAVEKRSGKVRGATSHHIFPSS